MNIASQLFVVTGGRVCKSVDPKTGYEYGGVYYPAHSKNGEDIQARWCGKLAINEKPYYKGNEKIEPCQFVPIVVWNNKNAATGKGLADIFARSASKGKEISCHFTVKSFEKRIFYKNQPLLDEQGNARTYTSLDFTLKDNLIFGADSGKLIVRETSKWNGNPTFDSRPPYWNVMGHADQVAWSTIVVPARNASVYNGGPSYGYARVIIPNGVQLLNMTPQTQASPQQQAPPQPPPLPPLQGATPTEAAAHLMENPPLELAAGTSTPL